jgi:hypothetical protein
MIADASYATIDRAAAKGWIQDDGDTDPLPQLSIYGNDTMTEGDSGQATVAYFVELAQPASTDVTFNIATSDGTATAKR